MICGACGQANRPGARFCDLCGAALARVCPACGVEARPTARFCDNCGQALEPATADREPPAEGQAALSNHPTSFCDGRYEVKRFLGEGGKKRVYLAHDTKLDRDVAFALIKTDGLDDEGLLRIRREAQAMGRLGDHPHIVSVYDIGETGVWDWGLGARGTSTASSQPPSPYLVTQLMAGGDLEGLIDRADNHRIPLAQALDIADQVCQALDYAHGKGIIHRDLKPGNVWLTAEGTGKLGDFGLAVALDRSRLTQAGMMVGTVSYMPPEQAMGGEVTARSDLYALGAMLYEMVTGRPPFVGDESVAIITQHLNTPPVAPSWHAPEVPPGLEALILRLLEKDPAKRPASAAEVRQILAGIQTRPHPHPLPEGEGEDAPPSGRGRPEGPGEGVASNPLYRQIFVGREAELRELQAVFDAALSGRGALVTVVGEPGIGKTALCEQLATYAAIRGGKALVGHCYEEGSLSLPYLAFVEAMRAYVLARDPDALKDELGSGAREVARIVSEIRHKLALSQDSGLSPQHSPDPEEERWRLLQAVSDFLKNASRVQPLLVVLEDLHWADRGTLDLLTHLARNLSECRLVVVATYRDVEVDRTHPLSSALAELRRLSAFERVALRGLSAPEVQRMLETITGQEIRWGLAEAVHRQTEGNPLFVQEVVRYLVEEGLIRREDGRWQRTGAAPLEMAIPEGLRDVIGKRLSRLSPECNQVLTMAAVLGREFDLRALLAIADMEEDALIAALDEAVRVGVLEERARGGEAHYRFAHAFFRQTLYEELSVPRRLRLHLRVGRTLEGLYGARVAEHASELADHFSNSSEPSDLEKAVDYGELAAQRAMAVNAYGEAARLLERTLDVEQVLSRAEPSPRCDLLLALAAALGPAGEPERVYREVAPAALALAEALGDQERAARACRMALDGISRYGGAPGRTTPAYREWAQLLDRYAAEGSTDRVHADRALSVVLNREGRFTESRALKLRALASARQLGDPELLLLTGASLINPANRVVQDYADGLELVDELVRQPRDGVTARTLAECLAYSQMCFLAAGQRARAEELWREVDQLARRSQDAEVLLWPLALEALRATLDGRLEDAIAVAAQLNDRGVELGMAVTAQGRAASAALWPRLYLGRWHEALDAVVAVDEAAGLQGQPFRLSRALGMAYGADANAAASSLAEALETLHVSAEEDDTPLWLLAELLAAAVLLGDHEKAALLARRLDGIVGGHGNPQMPFNIGRYVGAARTLLGDKESAALHYQRSLEWATQIGHRPEIALTRLEIAELLLDEAIGGQQSAAQSSAPSPQPPREALAHLDFAIEEFRAMKMQPSLERALRHKGLLRA